VISTIAVSIGRVIPTSISKVSSEHDAIDATIAINGQWISFAVEVESECIEDVGISDRQLDTVWLVHVSTFEDSLATGRNASLDAIHNVRVC